MMKLTRLLTCVVIVCAFGVVAAAPALAAHVGDVWTINGTEIVPSAKVKVRSGETRHAFLLKAPAAGEEIECKSVSLLHAEVVNIAIATTPNDVLVGTDTGELSFKECSNVKKSACKVEEPIIVKGSTSLALETVSSKEEIVDVFWPEGNLERTPAEVDKFEKEETGKAKKEQERLKEYTKIRQAGTGCTAPATTNVEGDGVAVLVESLTTGVLFKLPATLPTNEIALENGLHVEMKLKAFGVKAEVVSGEQVVEAEGAQETLGVNKK